MIIPSFDVKSDVRIRVHHFTPIASVDAPVVIMCHPTGFCASLYSSVVAHCRGLNVFGIDIRSHGYSEPGDVTKWQGFEHDLSAAADEILRRTGHTKFIGVGISSGSSAHILHYAQHPQQYIGLYLCEPILFPPGSDLTDRDALAASARKRRDTFDSSNSAFGKYASGGALSHLSPSSLALYCVHGFKPTHQGITLRCSREDEEAIYLSGGANGVFDALSLIRVPTVIAYGEMSRTITRPVAHMIADHIENARVVELAGTGHFTLLENPFLGAQSVVSFIGSLNTTLSS